MPESSLNPIREIAVAMTGAIDANERLRLVNIVLPEMLRRDGDHRGFLQDDSWLASRLIARIKIICPPAESYQPFHDPKKPHGATASGSPRQVTAFS